LPQSVLCAASALVRLRPHPTSDLGVNKVSVAEQQCEYEAGI